MPGLLGKKYNAPVARPLWPFFAAGGVILYGVSALQSALMNTSEFRNDPRNPNAGKKPSAAH